MTWWRVQMAHLFLISLLNDTLGGDWFRIVFFFDLNVTTHINQVRLRYDKQWTKSRFRQGNEKAFRAVSLFKWFFRLAISSSFSFHFVPVHEKFGIFCVDASPRIIHWKWIAKMFRRDDANVANVLANTE